MIAIIFVNISRHYTSTIKPGSRVVHKEAAKIVDSIACELV